MTLSWRRDTTQGFPFNLIWSWSYFKYRHAHTECIGQELWLLKSFFELGTLCPLRPCAYLLPAKLALRRWLVAQVRAKRPAAESVGEEEDFRSQLNSEIEVQGHHTTKQRLIKTRCSDRPKAVFLKNNWIRSSLPLFFYLPPTKKCRRKSDLWGKKEFSFAQRMSAQSIGFAIQRKEGVISSH